ncbi:MAG: NADH-quinone oxidoreductase subunit M [Candidatus Contendobacter sp.]|nr:NADH-quinone oxidoreductase subunit M [Candidatus Contendobacter sp.]
MTTIMVEWFTGLIPSLPLAAALSIGIALLAGQAPGERHERRTSQIALFASAGSLLAVLALIAIRLTGQLPETVMHTNWLTSGSFQVNLLVLTDRLSLTLAALSGLAGLLALRFAVNYMHREPGFHRFFMILSLFIAAIQVLVMAGNAVLTFVGWEVAGLCSYLLIAFFPDRPVAAENATRVFIANRIGDAGFLLGIAVSFSALGGADWATINAGATGLTSVQTGMLTGGFLLAAMAKSAQVPFAPWLARAMEGPTPSSALFYGAVMVHAGVYLLLRLQPLLESSPTIMAIIAAVGLTTALYGFVGGLVQTDIKSALIFATSGQIGLMVLACGLGFWQWALIHLCGHAVVRGYQFFSAPSILRQLDGNRARPVPAFLARQRWLYTAALHRFWLDDLANDDLVRPVQRLARTLVLFDTAVVDRATGLSVPAVNALSSLAQWEERQLGAGRLLERGPTALDEEQGIVRWAAEWIAAAFHWIEEQLIFKAAGQGIVTVSHRLGQGLSRVERGLGRSWVGMATITALLAALVVVSEGMRGDSQNGVAGFPLLSALLLVPLLGMVAAWRARQARTVFQVGLAATGVELALALWLLIRFKPNTTGMQWVEQVQLAPWLSYHMGIDGLNVLFLPLTALLGLLMMLYAEPEQRERPGRFVAYLLAQQAALIGMFTALNLLQFWLFALAEILPATLLIRHWGTSPARSQAARHFSRALFSGIVAILAGILWLGWNHAAHHGHWSFDLPALLATPLSAGQQSLIFILLFGGLAVRLALFPFHAWLPVVAQHGTVAVGIVLLVGAKVGIYALLRFVFPLLPAAAEQWAGWIMALGLAGMLYGALLALMQHDLRRLLAFAVISQSGALAVGLFSLNPAGLRGGLLLALNLGLAAAGLFMVAGLLQRRLGGTRFYRLGGLFDAAPLLGLTFLVVVLGSIAMPGTPGFEAAHLALEGILETAGWGIATLAAAGNVLAAGYLLWAYQRIFLARSPKRRSAMLTDLRRRERVMAGLLCAVMIGVGLYADPWIKMIGGAVDDVSQRLGASPGSSHPAPAAPQP